MTKSVSVIVHFRPKDRAALSRAAHDIGQSLEQVLERLALEWLATGKPITDHTPATPVSEKRQTPRKKTVAVAENQSSFDETM